MFMFVYANPGGTQIGVGQGCAAQASKPIPIFNGDFGQKGYPFLRIFREKQGHFGPIFFFKNFAIFAWQKTPKISKFCAHSEKLTHV